MLQPDGTERLKFCLDLQNTPKLWICGPSDAFLENFIMEKPSSQVIPLLTNSKELLNCLESQLDNKSIQWSQ